MRYLPLSHIPVTFMSTGPDELGPSSLHLVPDQTPLLLGLDADQVHAPLLTPVSCRWPVPHHRCQGGLLISCGHLGLLLRLEQSWLSRVDITMVAKNLNIRHHESITNISSPTNSPNEIPYFYRGQYSKLLTEPDPRHMMPGPGSLLSLTCWHSCVHWITVISDANWSGLLWPPPFSIIILSVSLCTVVTLEIESFFLVLIWLKDNMRIQNNKIDWS